MNFVKYTIIVILSGYLSSGAIVVQLDSIEIIKGSWILIKDSIDTSIGINTNAKDYDGKNWLYDTLTFKKKRYHFKNALLKDVPYHGEYGSHYIRRDTLFLKLKHRPYFDYYYKINRLTQEELIIEETIYTDFLGVFRIIGYYRNVTKSN